MKKALINIGTLGTICIVPTLTLAASNTNYDYKVRDSIIQQLQHDDWKKQANAIKELWQLGVPQEQYDEELKLILINTLEKENGISYREVFPFLYSPDFDKDKDPERYAEFLQFERYHRDLTFVVVELKDPRAVRALLFSPYPRHVTSIGKGAVSPLLNYLSEGDDDERSKVAWLLMTWTTQLSSDDDGIAPEDDLVGEAAEQVKQGLMQAATDDPLLTVRANAVRGLAGFPTRDVSRFLEELKQSDSEIRVTVDEVLADMPPTIHPDQGVEGREKARESGAEQQEAVEETRPGEEPQPEAVEEEPQVDEAAE